MGKTCVTGSQGPEIMLGVGEVGWTRTLHPSHEQGTLIISHCDTDNTLFYAWAAAKREVISFFRQLGAGQQAGGGCVCVLWWVGWGGGADYPLFAHIFTTMRDPRGQSVLFICRETDSNYCCVWRAEIWTHRQLSKWDITEVLMSKV